MTHGTGDLEYDTTVEGGEGRYSATLSSYFVTPGGPFGGYLAALCLRAAGAHATLTRPATFQCQFLSVADIDRVDIRVTTLRASSRAEAIRVAISQGEKPIVEAMVRNVAEMEGLDHGPWNVPSAPHPETLPTFEELHTDFRQRGAGFWDCVDARPIFTFALDGAMPKGPPPWDAEEARANATPQPPRTKGWVRLKKRATFDDPFVDAARTFIPLDWVPIGAASMPLQGSGKFVFFPSLDFAVNFHGSSPTSEWMYCEAESVISSGGVSHAKGTVWAEDGTLLATGMQQMFQRVMPEMPS